MPEHGQFYQEFSNHYLTFKHNEMSNNLVVNFLFGKDAIAQLDDGIESLAVNFEDIDGDILEFKDGENSIMEFINLLKKHKNQYIIISEDYYWEINNM